MSFEDSVNEASKEMGSTSDFYKFKEGDNKMRIMTEPMIQVSRYGHGICYEGAPYCSAESLRKEHEAAIAEAKKAGKSAEDIKKIRPANLTKKWMCWAISRAGASTKDEFGDELVLVTLPYGVSKTLMEMKKSEEAGFEGWPMPFDINIKAKNAGKKEVEYAVLASRKETPVKEEELAMLEKKTPVDQILDRMKQKAREKVEGKPAGSEEHTGVEYPQDDINPDDIPF